MIEVTINGEERELEGSMTISELLADYNLKEKMIVVEHNYQILPRDQYGSTRVDAGDRLEIVQMMAGG